MIAAAVLNETIKATTEYRIEAGVAVMNPSTMMYVPIPISVHHCYGVQGILANKTVPIDWNYPWQNNAIKEIISIANLPRGWDGNNSPSLPEPLREMAINFIRGVRLGSLSTPRFGPLSGGGLEIDWWSGHRREVEFYIEPNLSISYLRVENGNPLSEGRVTEKGEDSFEQLLSWLRRG